MSAVCASCSYVAYYACRCRRCEHYPYPGVYLLPPLCPSDQHASSMIGVQLGPQRTIPFWGPPSSLGVRCTCLPILSRHFSALCVSCFIYFWNVLTVSFLWILLVAYKSIKKKHLYTQTDTTHNTQAPDICSKLVCLFVPLAVLWPACSSAIEYIVPPKHLGVVLMIRHSSIICSIILVVCLLLVHCQRSSFWQHSR